MLGIYAEMDAAMRRLVEVAERDGPVVVVVVSDHGFQRLRWNLFINNYLSERGLLRLRGGMGVGRLAPEKRVDELIRGRRAAACGSPIVDVSGAAASGRDPVQHGCRWPLPLPVVRDGGRAAVVFVRRGRLSLIGGCDVENPVHDGRHARRHTAGTRTRRSR